MSRLNKIYNVNITRLAESEKIYISFPISVSNIKHNINYYELYKLSLIHKINLSKLISHTSKLINKNKNKNITNIDLRNKCPPIYDQGELGSCTANALCAAVQFDKPSLHGSRLFVYYNERMLENTIPYDAGALLSDGIKTLQKYGVCPESEWPYDITKFAIKPPQKCYIDSSKNIATKVANIKNDMKSMKNSLLNGYPFVVGIAIYDSFESVRVAATGMVPMPSQNDTLLGGHAVLCVGFDDKRQIWIMRNSWGINWGDKGYFYLPYNYLLDSNLSSDLWNIQTIK